MPASQSALIASRIAEVRQRIAAAEARAGRSPGEVALVAVSKVHGVDKIAAAAAAGQRLFGENYAQELQRKASAYEALRREHSALPEIGWHFIGHLQSNKAKILPPQLQALETVDRLSIAQAAGKRRAEGQGPLDLFMQVNVGREAQKSGVLPEEAPALADALAQVPGVRLAGLMTITPAVPPPERRPYFAQLRALRDSLRAQHPECRGLSMGMSADFEIAIEEGATLVRVGTAIFGPRPAPAAAPKTDG